MSEVLQIDMTPFICEAFASNKGTYKTIEKIYEQRRVEYYQAAKASKWYSHEILTSQSIEKEIVAKRSLAILLETDGDKLMQIIRKGWKSLYDYMKKQKEINITATYHNFKPNSKEGMDRLMNDEINAIGVIAILISRILDKPVNEAEPGYVALMKNLYDRLELAKGVNIFRFKSFRPDDIKRVRKLKTDIYEQACINRYFASFYEARLSGISDTHEALSYLFDLERLSTSIVEDEQLSERDIDDILATYCYVTQNEEPEKAGEYLVSGYVIRSLLRAYRRVKEQHFKTSRETLYLDLDAAQQEAKEACLEARQQELVIEQKNKEIESLQKHVKAEYSRAVAEYRDQLKTALVEIEELQQQLARAKAESEELREALFSPQGEPAEPSEPVDLSQYRAVIVGGHERWQTRMKEILPNNWRFIHPDKDYNSGIISAADIIFIFTSYLSHAVYYPVIGEARRRGLQVCYLRRLNEDDCLDDIQAAIRKAGS